MAQEEAAEFSNARVKPRGFAAIFRRLPWLTATALLIALASLAVLWLGNEARVALSYRAQLPARDVALRGARRCFRRDLALVDVAARAAVALDSDLFLAAAAKTDWRGSPRRHRARADDDRRPRFHRVHGIALQRGGERLDGRLVQRLGGCGCERRKCSAAGSLSKTWVMLGEVEHRLRNCNC